MSTPDRGLPEWTLADRLRKAREHAGIERVDLAETLGIHRNTVRNYEVGITPPKKLVIKAWAEATNAPVWWLLDQLPEDGTFIERRRAQVKSRRSPEPHTTWESPDAGLRTGRALREAA